MATLPFFIFMMYLLTGGSFFYGGLFNILFNFQVAFWFPSITLLIFLLLLIGESESNHSYPSLLPLIFLYVGLQQRQYGWNLVGWMLSNLPYFGLFLVGYVVVGFGWGYVKLHLYMRKNKYQLTATAHNVDQVVSKFMYDNKFRIYGWVIYWPFNLVYTFTVDFFTEIFDYLYEMFGNIYKKAVTRQVLALNKLTTTVSNDGVLRYMASPLTDRKNDKKN